MWSVVVSAASAATWTVGPAGADFATVSEAVQASTSGDQILVDPGTYPESVDLDGRSVDLIAPSGATLLPPAGQTAVRMVDGESGTLEGFTLAPTGARALDISGGSPLISGCSIAGAGSSVLDGGSIRVVAGSPRFVDLLISGSTGLRGGSIFAGAGASLGFERVTVEDSVGSWGGAIYLSDADLEAAGLAVARSSSDYSGGAIYLDGSVLVATDLEVSDGVGRDTWGACAYLNGSRMEVDGGAFSRCEASRFASGYSGGAVFADRVSTVRLTDVAISESSAFSGGGLALSGASVGDLVRVSFTEVLATASGGGAWVDDASTLTCQSCDFVDGTAEDGGLVYVGPDASFSASDGAMLFGLATGDGGALRAVGADRVALDGVAIRAHEADRGGALSLQDVRTAQLLRGTFEDSEARTGDGGALFATGGSDLLVDGCTFRGNVATSGDGGAIASSAPLHLSESSIDSNRAGRDGGALHVVGAELRLDGVVVDRNEAAGAGGGISVEDGLAVILRSRLHDNAATLGGGLASVRGDLRLEASQLTENHARDGGGAWILGPGPVELANLTFLANGATDRGGQVFVDGGPFRLINAIVALATDGGGVWAEPSAIPGTDAFHNDVFGNAGGDWLGLPDPLGASGNLAVDPEVRRFTADGDERDDDLHLAAGSPCIDAGIVDRFDPDGSTSDIGAFGGPEASTDDDDGDGWLDLTDCDDRDPNRFPGAQEVPYDRVDQDCDGEDLADLDGDGFDGPELDCDDLDPAIHPDAEEIWYDGVDQDCDEASDFDQDADGYDLRGMGGGDCDDLDPGIHPGIPEQWYDGIDQDCDGGSDFDQDRDGRDAPSGGGSDCDDLDPEVFPGAAERCDNKDQDCDELVDEDPVDPPSWYDDRDGDGHGDGEAVSTDCIQPGGTSPLPDDCDDSDGSVYPGATEIWYDGVDQDCDGRDDDQDLDGYGRDEDCDDLRPEAYPGAEELRNGLDDDCDGWAETDDRDGDGLADFEEWDLGTDHENPDCDDDGWLDGEEPPEDTDGDGRIDPLDEDDDGDDIPTRVEQDVDSDLDGLRNPDVDRDGVPNGRDLDSDGDGYPDEDEGVADLDRDEIPDFADFTGDFAGGGCHGGDGSALAVLGALIPFARRRRRAAALALLAGGTARAQGVEASGIQVFGTTTDRAAQHRLAPVNAGVPDTVNVEVGVWTTGTPLTEELPSGPEPLLGLLGTTVGSVSWAPADRLRLDAVLPWHLLALGPSADRFFVPGDLRLGAGFDVLRSSGAVPGVSVLPSLWIPTGAAASWLGAPTVAAGGVVSVGHEWRSLGWVANAGARWAPEREDRGVVVGPGPLAGIGAHWSPGDRVSLIAELFTHSAVGFASPPVEAQLLLRARTLEGRVASVAASVGLNDAVGAPAWRVSVSMGAGPKPIPQVVLAMPPMPDPCAEDPSACEVGEPVEVIAAPPDPLAELVDDRILVYEQVFFAEGRADVDPASSGVLSAVVEVLREHPEIDFLLIEGHTNTNGSASYNQRLSEARAAAVVDWLVELGADRDRLLYRGFGFSRPLVPSTDPDALIINRRVEFVVLRSDEAPPRK